MRRSQPTPLPEDGEDDSHGGSDIGDAKHLALALIMEACRNPAMGLWIDDSEAGKKNGNEATAPPSPIGRHHWRIPTSPAATRPIITPKRASDDNMDNKLFLATATFDVSAVDEMFLRKPDDSDEHEG